MSGVPRVTVWQRSLMGVVCWLAFSALSVPSVAAEAASPDPCNASPRPAYCNPDFRIPENGRDRRLPDKTERLGGRSGLITRSALTKAIAKVGRNGTIIINGDFDFTESRDTVISTPVTIRAGRRMNGPRVPCGWRISNNRGTVHIAGLRFIAGPGTRACITVEQGALAIAGSRFDAGSDEASTIDDAMVYIDTTGGDLTVGPKAVPRARRSSASASNTSDDDDSAERRFTYNGDFALPVEMYGPSVRGAGGRTADPRGTGIRIGPDASAEIENLKVSGMQTGIVLGGPTDIVSTSVRPVTLCNNTLGVSVSATRSGGGLFDEQAELSLSAVGFTGNQTAVEVAPSFAASVTLSNLTISGYPTIDCHRGWRAPIYERPSRGIVVFDYNFSGEVHLVGGTISDTDTAMALMGAVDLNATAVPGPAPTTEITANETGVALAQAPAGGRGNRLRGLRFAANRGVDLWIGPSAGGELELSVSRWSSDSARRSIGYKGRPRFSRCSVRSWDDERLKPLRKLCP